MSPPDRVPSSADVPRSGTGLARGAAARPGGTRTSDGGAGGEGGSRPAVAHLQQDNGELTEDVVQAAVVDSTAIDEDGGVPTVDVDEEDRLVGTTPVPEDVDPHE